MNNDGRGDRPNWDEPTDPGFGRPRGQYPPGTHGQPTQRYGQPGQQAQPGHQGQPGHYGQPGQPGQYRGRTYGSGPRPTAYGDDDLLDSPPPRNRTRMMVAIGGSVALVIMLVTVGFVLLSPGSKSDPVSVNDPQGAGGTTTTADPTTTPPATTTPAAPPTTTTSKKVVLPKPTVTVKPPPKEIPPPPPPPDPTCTAATYHGTAATRDQVKAALVAAGGQQYWKGVQLDPNLTVPLPTITVPVNLMKAVAWQESGWQSNIESCDHGIGAMQVMQPTADSTNLRFGTNFDINTLDGNTQLGAEYLERLIMYFGIYHFGQHFSLDTIAQVGPNNEQYSLLQVVVAAYNVGVGGVEDANDNIVIGPIGTQYSNNVIALMSNCVCLTY